LVLSIVSALAISGSAAYAEASGDLDALAQAIVVQDIQAAQSLFPEDTKVISFFNDQYHLESFEVMFENFKDSQRVASEQDGLVAFDICNGAAVYSIQFRRLEDGSVEIFYGTGGTAPPPIPYSMRDEKSHCDGVVRYVGGF